MKREKEMTEVTPNSIDFNMIRSTNIIYNNLKKYTNLNKRIFKKRENVKMDLNKMFKLTEQQKILGKISEESAYRKDIENYTDYGYAQGITDTLKAIKSIDVLSGKEFYEIFIKNIGDGKLGSMVKRLLQD